MMWISIESEPSPNADTADFRRMLKKSAVPTTHRARWLLLLSMRNQGLADIETTDEFPPRWNVESEDGLVLSDSATSLLLAAFTSLHGAWQTLAREWLAWQAR